MHNTPHTKETKEKIRQANLKNPTRYWLGKKRPDISKKAKKWCKERLKPYWFKKGHKVSNTGRTQFKKGHISSKKQKEIARKNWLGSKNPRWTGGHKDDVYLTVRINGKDYKEHRVVAEKILGRKLKPNEVIHHINKHKKDNRPKNLYLCIRAEHIKIHSLKKKPIIKSNL